MAQICQLATPGQPQRSVEACVVQGDRVHSVQSLGRSSTSRQRYLVITLICPLRVQGGRAPLIDPLRDDASTQHLCPFNLFGQYCVPDLQAQGNLAGQGSTNPADSMPADKLNQIVIFNLDVGHGQHDLDHDLNESGESASTWLISAELRLLGGARSSKGSRSSLDCSVVSPNTSHLDEICQTL